MDQLDKPLTFAIGLALGIAASSITLYILSKETEEEINFLSASRESRGTQTIPAIEPKVSVICILNLVNILPTDHISNCCSSIL